MNKEEKPSDKSCKFLELPECVLRVLFTYLDSTALYQLTKTCRYFECFIADPAFWRYIDARRNPNTTDKVEYCSEKIHDRTTHVFLKAKDKTSGLVPCNFFPIVKPFRNLRVLALENQRFHGSRLNLKDFPSCLEELSLKATHIKSATYFFQHSGQNMQKLRVLILDQCQWVTCSFLMSVAKYENLEIISAIKCLRLHLNMIPYLSVARYGCKKLKVFDCRFTSIGHELLRTFSPKESLQSLYFQSLKSAELDYKEFIFNQTYMHTDSDDTFNHTRCESSISDDSLIEYVNTSACDIIEKVPESVLYKDPYPECKCSCNKIDESRPPPLVHFEDYLFCAPPSRKSIKFVCHRHVQDVDKLSDHFREFFLSNQHQFYADVKASEVESEAGSSDSESEESYGTCCMYGMGRSMILLTPGNNPGTIQEEVIELNPRELEERGSVVSIFISTPLRQRDNSNSNNGNPMPSTSRSVQENSVNENLENKRSEGKKRHNEDKYSSETQPSKSKRARMSENLDRLSDEAKELKARELIESAGEMGRNVNEFVRNSMEMCNRDRGSGSRSREPSTSRVHMVRRDYGGAVFYRPQEAQGNSSNNNSSNNENCVPSTSKECSQNMTEDTGPSTSTANSRLPTPRVEINLGTGNINSPTSVLIGDPSSSQHDPNRASNEGASSSRQPVGTPRTAIITIRNRERSRFVNPLFIQIENRHLKKKSRLRRLSLRGFRKITNVALDYIKNLKLDLLDLTYTSVTKEGIENFLAYNPNCRVIHPLYCICKPLNPF